MKKNFKKISVGLISVIILSTGIAYAAPEMIQAFNQSEFTIKVNGKTQVHPEGLKPIVYNNRTYLPATFIAELLGANTSFDTSTKTVNIDMETKNVLNEKLIEEYELKIKELEEKIIKLESTKPVSSDYSKLPARLSKNGYNLTIEGLSIRDDGRDGRLYFTLKNIDADTGVKVDALATTIESNGQVYKASAKFQENYDRELSNWIRRNNEIQTYIPFSDLPENEEDLKELKVTIFLEENETYPRSETLIFKVLND